MLEFLAILGGMSLWALGGLVLFLVGGFLASEMDSAWVATLTVIVGILVAQYGFGIPVIATIGGNWLVGIAIILGYAVAGLLYTTFWGWPEYLREKKYYITRDYEDWAMDVDEGVDNSYDAFLNTKHDYRASVNKERLGTMTAMWPFALTGELLRKPAIWLWNTLYISFGQIFDRVGKLVMRRILSQR